MAATEVRRGDFVYRDVLFAETGGDKRHARASVADLRDLLLPKRADLSSQDETAHWYEAQLLHYGLSRTKNKNTAKVRLTTAITSGNLTVPQYIIRMEADMKKEYAAACRRIKTTVNKAVELSSRKTCGVKGRKRKADMVDDVRSATQDTKISVKVGKVTVDIDHQASPTETSKRRKATPVTKKITKTAAPKPRTKKQTTKKQETFGTGTLPNPSTIARPLRIPTNDCFDIHNQYQNDASSSSSNDAPPSYESHNFSRSPTNSPNPSVQISGTYNISTSSGDSDTELTLIRDIHSGEFWGRFIVAGHEGVLVISDITGISSQQSVMFTWRALNLETNQLLFRREQDGWMSFDGQGGVTGCWYGLMHGGDVEFDGHLSWAPDVEVEELMDRWDWFVRSAYGR